MGVKGVINVRQTIVEYNIYPLEVTNAADDKSETAS
jgi:hypothetical protein